MLSINLPQKPKYTSLSEKSGKIEILGCYPGYGTTLGNALRRVLLSSLGGAAITSVKIKGATHEFATIPGVMEDVIQIILNLKRVRLKISGDEPVKLRIKKKGEGKVLASDIKCPAGVEIINPGHLIATVTNKKTELDMELEATCGLGYVPVEQQARKEKEIGVIAIDAIYTPVERVNYEVENMRVGKHTDYNKITLHIITDGTITSREAFEKAVEILIGQFSALSSIEVSPEKEQKKELGAAVKEKVQPDLKSEETGDLAKLKITELKGLSTRTLNVLENNKISRVGDIVKMTEKELEKVEGMGEKGIKEIKKAIGTYGLTLKQTG